jgi:hypothetical protein
MLQVVLPARTWLSFEGRTQRTRGLWVRQAQRLRCFIGLLCCISGLESASALTPRPDHSPGYFSGEWTGAGESASYCYLNLGADGWGVLLVDGGAGDWLGARLQWRNQRQSIQVDQIVPMPASIQRRIMPMTNFVLRSGFNQSLSVTWNAMPSGCQLQRVETTARRLKRARDALAGWPPGEGRQ